MGVIESASRVKQGPQLPLDRCPHCNVAKPLLGRVWGEATKDHDKRTLRTWANYVCATCGGVVLTVSPGNQNADITHMWPAFQAVPEVVPVRAREYLSQAIGSIHAPAGAVMLTASAVDAMLKDKGYKEGTLNQRIDAAAAAHIITAEMAAWAHEIRLDANDQRHADESGGLPSEADALKVIEFANALAQFLYVLPARVERGRKVPGK